MSSDALFGCCSIGGQATQWPYFARCSSSRIQMSPLPTAAAAAKGHFAHCRKRNGVPEAAGVRLDSCFASWSERLGDIETVVARFGRVSNLIVVPRPSSSSVQGQRCFDAAVFESGRPTLIVGEKLPFAITDHVIIAWNGSLEASRALLARISHTAASFR